MAPIVCGYSTQDRRCEATADHAKAPIHRKSRLRYMVRAGSAGNKGGPITSAAPGTASTPQKKWIQAITHFGKEITRETGGIPYGRRAHNRK